MMIARRALATAGIAVGAIGLGVGSAAAVDGIAQDEPVGEVTTTTTTEATTTTSAPTTTTTTEATTTTSTTTTTEAPSITEPPSTGGEPESGEAPFGLCNAFSGRSQPGNSQAWQRLYEQAGGDIEGYCETALADHRAKKSRAEDGSEIEKAEKEDGHRNGGEQKGRGHKDDGVGDLDSEGSDD